MKRINLIFNALMLSCIIFLSSCNDDDQLPRGDYENGILIAGEGSGAGTGSISFVADDLRSGEDRIFNTVNGEDLGTFLQSVAFDDNQAYIIVDNQNTITVVNRFTFEKLGEITIGLQVPRFMVVVDNKGYVTNWGSGSFGNNVDDDFIAVVDLTTLQVTSTINVEVGPEQIVYQNGRLFVSHKGGYGSNNKITVIDTSDDSIERVIEVKDKPDEMAFTSSGDLVVLVGGNESWTGNETLGSIMVINTNTLNVESELDFASGVHPGLMYLDDNMIYYTIGNDVFSMSANSNSIPTTSLLTATDGFLYGMAVRNSQLYALNVSFTDISEMIVFDLNTNTQIQTIDAPLGAAKIYFN